jgi:hypothetical protein
MDLRGFPVARHAAGPCARDDEVGKEAEIIGRYDETFRQGSGIAAAK